jgi:hypothetical protein
MSHGGGAIQYHYVIQTRSGVVRSLTVMLDPESLRLLEPEGGWVRPAWAELKFNQCSACPLDASTVTHCPAALALAPLVKLGSGLNTDDTVQASVFSAERTYVKGTTLTGALSSLLGLLMAASGCPALERLRPLARNHLPFATLEETAFRVYGLHLLTQHLRQEASREPDWAMRRLARIYERVRQVNAEFSARFRAAGGMDAALAALANLDKTASMIPYVINETFGDLKKAIKEYTED